MSWLSSFFKTPAGRGVVRAGRIGLAQGLSLGLAGAAAALTKNPATAGWAVPLGAVVSGVAKSEREKGSTFFLWKLF